MIALYPDISEISLDDRTALHPIFKSLKAGISEFTFANIYLFRETHTYKVSRLKDGIYLITGRDGDNPFFMLPFGLPEPGLLGQLFREFISMKCVPEEQAAPLACAGYSVVEDRDNFDYLYTREDLVTLSGDKLHKKRSLIHSFIDNYSYEGKPLVHENMGDAIKVLEKWCEERGIVGDYIAAREALEKADELQLCGGIYYVAGQPAAYTLGEEIAAGETFVIHFEKAVGGYKGLYQFVNQSFASILPEKYRTINREQDLGDEGLRQAKMTYRPAGFIKKYRVSVGLR